MGGGVVTCVVVACVVVPCAVVKCGIALARSGAAAINTILSDKRRIVESLEYRTVGWSGMSMRV